MARQVSERDFIRALQSLPKPRGKQLRFLRAHVKARGKALTMEQIARAAGYAGYSGGNLQYGLLARRIASAAGVVPPDPAVELLVESVPPKGVTNRQWVLVMRAPFASALEKAGWV